MMSFRCLPASWQPSLRLVRFPVAVVGHRRVQFDSCVSARRSVHQISPAPRSAPTLRATVSGWPTSSAFTSTNDRGSCNSSIYQHTKAYPSLLKSLPFLTTWGRWYHSDSSGYNNNSNNKKRVYLDMNSCLTIEEAVDMTYGQLEGLQSNNLSAFWTRVSQLVAQRAQRYQKPPPQRHRFQQQQQQDKLTHRLKSIFAKTMEGIKNCRPRDLAQTTLGFAKVIQTIDRRGRGYIPGTPKQILHELLIGVNSEQQRIIFQSTSDASMPILQKFEARYLANLAYANAIIGSVPKFDDGSNLFDHIADKSMPLLGKFEPQGLSNMVWSFEKVGVSRPKLFKGVAEHITSLDNLEQLNPQDFSNILLAFAKAGESHPKLFEKIADHIAHDNLYDFNPQALSNIVWAFAKAGVSHSKLLHKVADHIIALDNLRQFAPQALSNIVWAMAKAGESHPRLFEKIADHIVELDLDPFQSQNISNILWSFATAGVSHPKLFVKIADYIVQHDKFDQFNVQDLSNTVWAFAIAGVSHSRLFEKIADHMVQLYTLDQFNAQDLSITVFAFAKAGVKHPTLFHKVADHILALDNLHSFQAQNCSQLLWAYATADVIHMDLFYKVYLHIEENIDLKSLSERDQLNLLWASQRAQKARKETVTNLDDSIVNKDEEQLVEETEETLNNLTVPVLKDRLREKGMKVGGRKAELIHRLLGKEE